MGSDMNLLVSRSWGGLGDQIGCSVAARALKEKYPEDDVTFRCDAFCHPLWYDQGFVNRVISGTGSWEAGTKQCGKCSHKWDATRTPGGHAYSYELRCPKCSHLLVCNYQYVVDLDGPERRYDREVKWDIKKSRIQVWCAAVDHIPDDLCPHWTPTEDELRGALSDLEHLGIAPFQYVGVQWQAAKGYKDLPPAKTAQLILDLVERDYRVIVFHDQTTLPDEIMQKADVALQLPIRKVATYTMLAGLMIAPDSGLLHMAAATDTPCLGLFGPTDPVTTTRHYPQCEFIWPGPERCKHIECTKPCWGEDVRGWSSGNQCTEAHTQCMNAIEVEEIKDNAIRMVRDKREYNRERLAKIEGKPVLKDVLDPEINTEMVNVLHDIPADCRTLRESEAVERSPS